MSSMEYENASFVIHIDLIFSFYSLPKKWPCTRMKPGNPENQGYDQFGTSLQFIPIFILKFSNFGHLFVALTCVTLNCYLEFTHSRFHKVNVETKDQCQICPKNALFCHNLFSFIFTHLTVCI